MAKCRRSPRREWRLLVAALGVAIAVVIIPMAAFWPAAAYPVQAVQPGNVCPNGWTFIGAGPLEGYCGENSGNTATGCPPGWGPKPVTFDGAPVCNLSSVPPGAAKISQLKAGLVSLIGKIRYFGPWSDTLPSELVYSIEDLEEILKQDEQKYGFHLGMSVPPGPTNPIDAFAVGGVLVTHGSLGISDSAGLFAPGSMVGFKDTSGAGGITGAYSFSGLPVNQRLSFYGFFDYQRDNLTVGGVGSAKTDNYTFGGAFRYNIGNTYLTGEAAYNFGYGREGLNADGSAGTFNTHGFWGDLRIGHIFVLLNTINSASRSGMPTKAPPKPDGGYILALDVSGHLGFSDQQLNGFTDSSGFAFGTGETRYGDIGGRVKLFAVVPSSGFVWMPYVAGTVDQEFGFSSALNIPAQTTLPSGDLITLQEAQTFWGSELGVDVRGPNGWTVGAKGFYEASADTSYIGGTGYVKIPLNYTPRPVFVSRY